MRYHRKRWSAGFIDGRSKQALKAAAHAEATSVWRSLQDGKAINLGALPDWLVREHGYPKMGWLPPSPDGIAMCQDRGVVATQAERTAI